ncbi:DMT family transporter [Roseomonas populi]|uniref:DMT family transporter n=1 Tax=Roseomonas populi TaxID=3121582 RepID=A0ABT1X072_9PROT|nr:DMT family transporter [Roseomonas pecuniae]MCR0981502.1 DMT family transporter [Roseomonas pecuniae]
MTLAAPDRLRGLAWALVAVLVAATYPAITRMGVTQQAMTPLELATLRFLVAGAVLLPVFIPCALRLDRRGWAEAALLAFCQGTPLAALIAAGLVHAPAAHGAALTLGLMPAITLLLGLVAGRRPGRNAALGAVLIAAGAALLAVADAGDGGSALLGYGMFVLAAVMGGIYFVRLRASGFTAAQGAAFVAVLSGLGGLAALAVTGRLPHLAQVAPHALLVQAGFQGLLVGVLTMVALNRAIALLGPAPATVCLSLVPGVAAAIAVPLLGEVPSPEALTAIAAMVAGAVLSTLPSSPPVHGAGYRARLGACAPALRRIRLLLSWRRGMAAG